MRRRDVLGLIAGAALPWPYPTRASQALLDDTVGFTGQILFLSVKTPALVLGVVRNGQTSIQGFGRRAATRANRPPPTRCSESDRSPKRSPASFSRASPRTAWSASPIR